MTSEYQIEIEGNFPNLNRAEVLQHCTSLLRPVTTRLALRPRIGAGNFEFWDAEAHFTFRKFFRFKR